MVKLDNVTEGVLDVINAVSYTHLTMRSFPELLDIGIMGQCSAAKAGMCSRAVSYTHLDVYKRQVIVCCLLEKINNINIKRISNLIKGRYRKAFIAPGSFNFLKIADTDS